jgi:DNA polymerase-3 subunit epsilon
VVSSGIGGIIDVETTGFGADRHEILEFCMLMFSFDWNTGRVIEVVDEYCGLREPSRPISPGACRVHGITNDLVRGKHLNHPRIAAMFERVELLIAHNAAFDRSFVERLFPVVREKPWCCTMRGINWKGRGFRSRALQSLLGDHGIEVTGKHRAGEDARAVLALLSYSEDYLLELLASLRQRPLRSESVEWRCGVREAAATVDGKRRRRGSWWPF